VDRRFCSEFCLLEDVCTALQRAGTHLSSDPERLRVLGLVQVYVSGPPCLSCVGAFRQFQLLLPRVDLRIALGSSCLDGWGVASRLPTLAGLPTHDVISKAMT